MQEFAGNTDQDTVVFHDLNPPITSRYIRFLPVAWYLAISMRVELYGCTGTPVFVLYFSNIYKLYMLHTIFSLLIAIKNSKKCPAASWLDSSVGRALHRYRRGHGFESRSGPNFFQALISQLLKLCA